VSYDFATWLIAAEMARVDAGAERLHVLILPDANGVGGWFRDKTALYDLEEMHWRLWHLVLPLCRLIGATVGVLPHEWVPAARRDEYEQTISHHAGGIIAAARGARRCRASAPAGMHYAMCGSASRRSTARW
jgi:hypothetical protein